MTASLLALQINMNRKKGAKAVNPAELNPFLREQKKKIMLSGKDLKNVLCALFCAPASAEK